MRKFRPDDFLSNAGQIRRHGEWFLEAYENQGAPPPTLADFARHLSSQCPDMPVRLDILGGNFNSLSPIQVTYDRRMIWRDRHRQVAWEARVGKRPKKKKK